jgi:hypothetical protein
VKTRNLANFVGILKDFTEANRSKALRIEEEKMCHSVPAGSALLFNDGTRIKTLLEVVKRGTFNR